MKPDFHMTTAAFTWLKKYKIHLLVWLLFILYETVLIGVVFKVFGHPLTYLVHYLAAIVLFYMHAGFALPWSLTSAVNAIWKVPVIIVMELGGFVLICFVLDDFLIGLGITKHSGDFKIDLPYCLKTLYRGVLFAGFGTGYYFLNKFNQERDKATRLEQQRLTDIIYRQRSEQQLAKAENDFLKAQINPHFLFNTLDFIYHNILAVSPAAANTIIALSEMMRFAIDADKTGGFIVLGEELEQVEHLVYLTQLRKKEPLKFILKADSNACTLKLIPLLLLTLAENIIKHGNLNNVNSPATFEIRVQGSDLLIETCNLIASDREVNKMEGHGLSNIGQRLKYAYGGKANLSFMTERGNYFITKITINVEALEFGRPASAAFWSETDKERLHEVVG